MAFDSGFPVERSSLGLPMRVCTVPLLTACSIAVRSTRAKNNFIESFKETTLLYRVANNNYFDNLLVADFFCFNWEK